ncbi:autotransporter-associated beta strand repeat-containing protein [Neorhodopirellula lusitana]|uniref:Autotransporter-associated beta strand repeat-containing protein n=1 Tax=Neorhodopirellula lusitana TaxID=445327 RepID=A0ABY1PQ24_9BACT|nr:putative Ig domain-containing protein [Neorhodopirellula lusitana]SMP40243.1 autotransporter-associated beta strand repeat-containing protein [Neorhodopirellula lusitana]
MFNRYLKASDRWSRRDKSQRRRTSAQQRRLRLFESLEQRVVLASYIAGSLAELRDYGVSASFEVSNDTVTLSTTGGDPHPVTGIVTPGEYWISGDHIENPTSSEPTFLELGGENNTYVLTGTSINLDTRKLDGFGRALGHDSGIEVVKISGSGNTINGLDLTGHDLAMDTDPGAQRYADWAAVFVQMTGSNNTVDDVHVLTRGSSPYGYGDVFGKGARQNPQGWDPGPAVDENGDPVGNGVGLPWHSHNKTSAFQVIDTVDAVINDMHLESKTYGHGFFVQGTATNTTLTNSTVTGELFSSNDTIATDLYQAYGFTSHGNVLPADMMISGNEDGVRMYSGPSGFTVQNVVVNNMRTGFSVALGRGTINLDNVEAYGTENAFNFKSNTTITNAKGDITHGPLIHTPYDNGKNSSIDVELVGGIPEGVDWSVAYINGDNMDVTITSDLPAGALPEDSLVRFGQVFFDNWRDSKNPTGPEDGDSHFESSTFINNTNQMVVLGDDALGNTGSSLGYVITNGKDNAYDGISLVPSGTHTVVQHVAGLGNNGSTADGTLDSNSSIIASGGTLEIQADIRITNEKLTISGDGVDGIGALYTDGAVGNGTRFGSSSNGDASTIFLDGDASIGVGIDGNQFLVGRIQGTGNLTKLGEGMLSMEKSSTFDGNLIVAVGSVFGRSGVVHRDLTVAAGASISANSNRTYNTGGDVTVEGLLDLNGRTDESTLPGKVGRLLGAGQVSTTNPSTNAGGDLEIAFDASEANFSGDIATAVSLTKSGSGTQIFSGSNTYTGTTLVSGGLLQIDGSHSGGGQYTVEGNAALGGNGTIDSDVIVNASGHLSPGASAGTLSVGDLTLVSGAAFDVELGGTVAGVDYDQLLADLVTLGGSLNVSLLNSDGAIWEPSPTDAFTILSAGTDLSGMFENVASGERLETVGGEGSFLVTYDSASDSVELSNYFDNFVEALSLDVVADSISENGTATATVTRNMDTTTALTVTLANSDAGELNVPATITIPAGQTTSVPFVISGVDDLLVDGTQTVTLTAQSPGVTDGIDTLDVTDVNVAELSLEIAGDLINENGGTTTATVSRNTDTVAPLTVTLTSDDTDEVSHAISITIPAGQTISAPFTISGVNDLIVDGTQTVTMTAAASGYISGTDMFDVSDDGVATLFLAINASAISENGSAAVATVSRNTDTASELVVMLVSSDTSELAVPTTITIPAGQASSDPFLLDGVGDSIVDGTQTVAINASADGFVDGAGTIDITDDDVATLQLVIDVASIGENGGVATATVSRNSSTAVALTVMLASNDTGEASVSGSITIPAGQVTSDPFAIAGVDDFIVDGTQSVTLIASSIDHVDGTGMLDVADDDVAAVTLNIAAVMFREDGGVTTATVSRNTDVSSGLTVTLNSSDPGEASVPATITIPAGQATSSLFTIAGVNDSIVDGTQTITITTLATDHASDSGLVYVTDDDVATLTLNIAAAAISENGSTTTATVTRNTDTTNELVVTLANSDASELSVPATVTIPAAQASSNPFVIDGIRDSVADGTQTVTVTAIAADHADGGGSIDVTDDDVAAITLMLAASSIGENGGATTGTVARNTDTSSELTVTLTSSDSGEATVPSTITIPAGQTTSAPFAISGVDDSALDGAQSVTLTATAALHATDTGQVVVTDDEVPNETPVLENPIADQIATEDSLYSLVIPADTFRDPNGDALQYSATLDDESPLPAWLSFDSSNREFLGTPLNEDVGTFTVRVSVSDPDNETASDQFLVSVINTNESPTTRDDVIAVNLHGSTVIDPLANDFDIDGSLVASTLTITTPPQFGQLQLVDGLLSYVPAGSFGGQDSFAYTVQDDQEAVSDSATVSLIARPYAGTIVAGTSVNRSVALDIESHFPAETSLNTGTITILTGPMPGVEPDRTYGPHHGSAEVTGGQVVYSPVAGSLEPDTLYITVEDQNGIKSDPIMISMKTVRSRLENPRLPQDVDYSGDVTPRDALLVINRLNRVARSEAIEVDQDDDYGIGTNDGVDEQWYYDVTGDLVISALDALWVINRLNDLATEDEPLSVAEREERQVPSLAVQDHSELGVVQDQSKLVALESTSSTEPLAAVVSISSPGDEDNADDQAIPPEAIDTVLTEMFN